MSNPPTPPLLPDAALPAAAIPDLFHRYLDVRMRSARGVGNGSQFLFEVDGDVDTPALEGRLEALQQRLPMLSAGLGPWPSRRWTVQDPATVSVREESLEGESEDTVNDWFARWFGEPFMTPERPSLELVLARTPGAARSVLLVRWLHLLSDAPGMDLLLRLLDGDDPARFKLEQQPAALSRRVRGDRSALQRAVGVHNLALRHLARSIPPPLQAKVDRRARQTARICTLSREETTALWQRARELGGLDRNTFLLGALARACVRAWSPASWRSLRIPVPISLRPPAWRGPVLGNWFTMVLVQVPVRSLGSLESAVQACRTAWRAALERGEDAATLALMGPAATLPPWLARFFLDGPRLQDGATVNTSYVELGAGKSGTFLGLPLRRAVIASSILAPPGLAGVFSGCAGRLSVVVPGQEGPSGDALHRELLALLRGEAA
ncbi:MAG: hypothetical protein KDA24_01155 [Deltaproteobacteria bacterium]|nr:hypothetical protein [Deltaproteobacteria bacterium]